MGNKSMQYESIIDYNIRQRNDQRKTVKKKTKKKQLLKNPEKSYNAIFNLASFLVVPSLRQET